MLGQRGVALKIVVVASIVGSLTLATPVADAAIMAGSLGSSPLIHHARDCRIAHETGAAPTEFTYDIPKGGATVTLPIVGVQSTSTTISWGDCSDTLPTTLPIADYPSHTFANNTNAIWQFSVWVDTPTFSAITATEGTAGLDDLVGVSSWGDDPNLVSLHDAFLFDSGLVSVPRTLPSTVTDLSGMFEGAYNFNQDLSTWQTAHVDNLSQIFNNASAFNGSLTDWNTSNVTNMAGAFYKDESFDQNLGTWNIGQVTDMFSIINWSGMSISNYSATLMGWGQQAASSGVQPHLVLVSQSSYLSSAASARQFLITTDHWKIDDFGPYVATPAITGTPGPGDVLTVHPGTWFFFGGLVACQWLVDGRPIAGANKLTFTPSTGELLDSVEVEVWGWILSSTGPQFGQVATRLSPSVTVGAY